MSALKQRLETLWHSHGREIAQFLSVGGLAFIINSAVTWSLMHSIFSDGHAKAKVVAGIVATIFSWVANRLWTFREKRTGNNSRHNLLACSANRCLAVSPDMKTSMTPDGSPMIQ